MFEFHEFDLLADMYIEKHDNDPRIEEIMKAVRESDGFREAVAKGVDMDQLTAAVYAASDKFQKMAFTAGLAAMVRMIAYSIYRGGKPV